MIGRHGNAEWAEKFCVTSGKEGNMSRIGKTPIEITSGVEVVVTADSVEVKGPKGTLAQMTVARPHPILSVVRYPLLQE